MKLRFLSIALLAATLLGSCNQKGYTPEADDSAVQFTTEISKVATRASGTAWDANDQIGMFMKTAGGSISTAEGLNASNVKYTTNGTNFTTLTPIYYPQAGTVDFVAYYPYRTTPATDPYIYKVDVSTQTTPAAIDLLWSANAVGKSKSTTAVPLTFDHMLSRVVLNITKGEGMTDAEMAAMGIQITGMPTKADFDLANGTLGTASDIAAITPRTVTAGTTYDAIVIPQAGTTGRKMVFMVGTDVYECPIPDADDFVSGKSYAYAITVKKTGVTVSRGTITDWTGTAATPENLGEGEQMSIPIPMVLIPAGTFFMGSPTTEPNRDNDEIQHSVTLTKDFYMSKYHITNAQYAAFLNDYNAQNPGNEITDIESQGKYNIDGSNDGTWFSLINSTDIEYATGKWQSKTGFDNHPFINVSHHGALAFCEFYGYRLPTEAEWEYACRGAYANKATETATLPFGIGDGSKLYADMANFNGAYPYVLPNGHIDNFAGDANHPNTYLGKTQPVGSYLSNSYGLYDMHGNVWEWCSDWHGAYSNTAATDPIGPPTGATRVLRGGSWRNSGAKDCRSAVHYYDYPGFRINDIGFRVVFVP